MSVGIGLRVGSIVSTTVVAANDAGTPDPAVIARDTVLYVYPDGGTVLGGAEPLEEGAEHSSTVSGFLARVGDPDGVTGSDGTRYRAEDVVASALRSLLRECEPLPSSGGRTGGTPDVVAAYPSRWDAEIVSELREALDYAGLQQVSLVSDAEATSAWFASEIADRPGQLVGTYHVDDGGATLTLVRAGSVVGRSFRFPAGSGSSPTSQLSSALGAFGWLPSNLDAVVVTGDGLVARDADALRGLADSITQKFGVRCVVGPGPEQAAALGAAVLAAGFSPAVQPKRPIGLPPSYDVTEVFAAIPGRKVVGLEAGAEPPVATATVASVEAAPDDETADVDEAEPGKSASRKLPVVLAAVVVVVLLLAGAAVLLL
ncbi:hypothetical protein [Rhodococcus tukisamuensis]|uniref:DUF7159 domain-containing protein n=1 Tax=Rhodococcus tukisamuensis TaxID=168276 RepID=A0A1G6Y2P7_9NOCA|nr:hypothetical protein [Rhodococcus tukisamuensis]SDD84551.1 hypothetical protein SAMN05444580_10719 [Rhodococcus tukisamuensis]